jgi:hypothetical protein
MSLPKIEPDGNVRTEALLKEALDMVAQGLNRNDIYRAIVANNPDSDAITSLISELLKVEVPITKVPPGGSRLPPLAVEIPPAPPPKDSPAGGDFKQSNQTTRDFKTTTDHQDNQRISPTYTEATTEAKTDGVADAGGGGEKGPPFPQPGMPFVPYLVEVINWLQAQDDEPGRWQSPLWEFMRLMKAHEDLARVTAASAFKKVDAALKKWVKKIPAGHCRCGWCAWLAEACRDDAEAEFFSGWEKVRYIAGMSPLQNAVEQADRNPLFISDEKAKERPELYQRFVSIAGWLQVAMGDRAIMLPVIDVAKILGVQPRTVSTYRKWAIEDGFLCMMKRTSQRTRRRSSALT